MEAATGLGDAALTWPVIAVVVGALAAGGHRAQAWRFGGAVAAALATMLVAKLVFGTWRSLGVAASLRSPSGHAASAALAWGGTALLLAKRRGVAVATGATAAAAVGWTRVALGMHTPAEVLFGWAIGMGGVWAGSCDRPSGVRPGAGISIIAAATIVILILLLHATRAPIEPQLLAIETKLRCITGG